MMKYPEHFTKGQIVACALANVVGMILGTATAVLLILLILGRI